MRDRLSPQQRQVLEALRDHPFLTARQLSWHLRQNNAAIQRHLWQMQRRSLVRRYPLFVAGERKVQWLYTLTTQGLQTIAGTTGTFLSAYQQKHGYSISRLRWLALVAERVYHTREVLRFIEADSRGWFVSHWDTETEIRYEYTKGWRWLTFQCSALLANSEKRWVPLMIEWDSGDIPIEAERARWKNLIAAQDDAKFDYSTGYHFPVLIYIAQNAERLHNFIELVNQIKVDKQILPTPIGYVTYRAKIVDLSSHPNDGPIWFDTEHNEWVDHVLANCKGNSDEPWGFWQTRPLRKSFASTPVEIEPWCASLVPHGNVSDLAALALALRPVEKKLVRAIGSHPLLTARELAFLLESTRSKVWDGLKRLTQWQLIEAHLCRVPMQHATRWDKVRAYTLSNLGLVYLATAAGLGTTPKRMALARGWEKGFGAQVAHTEHTRIGNELFLQLLQYARTHSCAMTWYSEQEARLYLNLSNAQWSGPFQSVRLSPSGNHRASEREEENDGEREGTRTAEGTYGNRKEFFQELARHGTRFRRFLPDGRAVLQIGDQAWHIAIEIDLTRANYAKMIAKLNYYYLLLDFHLDELNLCILLVTHHWQRAHNLYWLAWQRASKEIDNPFHVNPEVEGASWSDTLAHAERETPRELAEKVLPMFITTVDDLRRNGTDSPIWLSVREQLGPDGRVNHTFNRARWLKWIEELSKHRVRQIVSQGGSEG